VDAFPDANSGKASQQEGVRIQVIFAAEFVLKATVIIRGQRSGEKFRESWKIVADDQTGLEVVALIGQIVQQPAETKQTLSARRVANGRMQLAKPTKEAQHMRIASKL
jgi:hypothetical protein